VTGFFQWLGRRVSADRQQPPVLRPRADGRVRDNKPADEVVQDLFSQISQGGQTERRAWSKLAKYLARPMSSAPPIDLIRP
jgi:hypothetical protein